MSKRTRRRDEGVIFALRLFLLIAYLPLAHFAATRNSPVLATFALGDVGLMFLIEPVFAMRAWAWLATCAMLVALAFLASSPYAALPLLLVPVLFLGMVCWWFARSLLPGRVPLIARIVAGIYRETPDTLSPQHRRYTRRLTSAWAALLGALAAVNLSLALIAVPDGIFARFGIASPFAVTEEQWSLVSNVLNYGIVGGFMLIEYQWRKRVFPVRPYRDFADFVRQMAALGPGFWRDVFR